MADFADGPEIPLEGGDVTEGLVRIGDTVRRPRSAVSDSVGLLLRHLESVGFDGAPRFLPIDRSGRDVLSFVDGEVAGRPWPAWTADDARLASVARLLSRLHDAVEPLGVPDWASAIPVPAPEGIPASIAEPPELVGHRDITPENVVFRDGRAVALIDFDLLGPTTRAEELTNLLLWWGAWMPVDDREAALCDADPGHRAVVALDAYGLPADERARLVPLSIDLAERSWHLMRWRSEHLGGGWARMWSDGVGGRIERRRAWLEQQADALIT